MPINCQLYHTKKGKERRPSDPFVEWQFLKLILVTVLTWLLLHCKGGMKMASPMCSLSTLMFLFGRFADPRSIETQTNPIDRTIALLLFHQSSDHAVGAVDDASSLKSPASVWFLPLSVVWNHPLQLVRCDELSIFMVQKKQHQGPATNQGMMTASSTLYSPRMLGGPKDAQSQDNYWTFDASPSDRVKAAWCGSSQRLWLFIV